MAFRDGPFENLKVPLTWTAAVVVVVAIVGAILLLATDRRSDDGVSAYGALRSGTEAVAAPAGDIGLATASVGGGGVAINLLQQATWDGHALRTLSLEFLLTALQYLITGPRPTSKAHTIESSVA